MLLTLYGYTKTAEQRIIIQQYGDRYNDILAVDSWAVTFGIARRGLRSKNITQNSQNQGFWKFWSIAAERLCCCV